MFLFSVQRSFIKKSNKIESYGYFDNPSMITITFTLDMMDIPYHQYIYLFFEKQKESNQGPFYFKFVLINFLVLKRIILFTSND